MAKKKKLTGGALTKAGKAVVKKRKAMRKPTSQATSIASSLGEKYGTASKSTKDRIQTSKKGVRLTDREMIKANKQVKKQDAAYKKKQKKK